MTFSTFPTADAVDDAEAAPAAADGELARLRGMLLDAALPLDARFRALFSLKSLASDAAVDAVAAGFADTSDLLRHELAYVLGQMRNPHAVPVLLSVLEGTEYAPMVRHEAAEALGAIGEPSCLAVLRRYATATAEAGSIDVPRVVRETCELAVAKIELEQQQLADPAAPPLKPGKYTSVDPAPPIADADSRSTADLAALLLDTSRPLFDRYRAMFALRDRGDEEAVRALARGLDDDSALFRHEIAYVFGQMQHPASVKPLVAVLSRGGAEEGMVRHECAEALGSIATADCLPALRANAADPDPVVRDSCQVGLDIFRFEESGEFQYAEPIRQGA